VRTVGLPDGRLTGMAPWIATALYLLDL